MYSQVLVFIVECFSYSIIVEVFVLVFIGIVGIL